MRAEPKAVCDGGDLDCGSGLLLIIRNAMAPLAAGGILEVRSRELSVKEDLPAWCRMVGHSLLHQRGADGGYTHYFLRKKGDDQELQADLLKAKRTLTDAITRIEQETKRLFLTTFEAVRANFQRLFRRMFGGGSADILLTNPAEPLASGVDIIAKPPGK